MRSNYLPQFTAAFAIGLGVGALLGIVLAPQSGEETRKYLRERAQDGVDEAVAQGKKIARDARRATDNAKDFVNDAMENGKAAYREVRG